MEYVNYRVSLSAMPITFQKH